MANQRDLEFQEFANKLVNWFEFTYTKLALDELSPKVMNSRAKREELAMHLNEWAKDLFQRASDAVEANFNGHPQRGDSSIPELIYFPRYAPLNAQYLQRKTQGYGVGGKKGNYTHTLPQRSPNSFFLLSGNLSGAIAGLGASIPRVTAGMVRVSRVVASETHRRNPKTGRVDRTFRVLIDELGQFTRKPQTSGWVVKVLLPPALSAFGGSPGYLEGLLFPEDTSSRNKLVNAGSGSRPYRPLLEPYVQWFVKYRTPDAIRQAYSRKP